MKYSIIVNKIDGRSKEGKVLVSRYETPDIDTNYELGEIIRFVENIVNTSKTLELQVEPYVLRKNYMNDKEFYEPFDTKYYCSPSSETYWSM